MVVHIDVRSRVSNATSSPWTRNVLRHMLTVQVAGLRHESRRIDLRSGDVSWDVIDNVTASND